MTAKIEFKQKKFSVQRSCSANSNNIELVLVHLGTTRAKYLIENLRLIQEHFPTIRINLVLSDNSILSKFVPVNVNKIVYRSNEKMDEIFTQRAHESRFRNGYWRFTIERLLAIESTHAQNQTVKLLHIESDVFLMPNFPFASFQNVNNVSWMPYNESCDVASIVFFPNFKKTKLFSRDMIALIQKNPNISDMQALRELRIKFPQRYKTLPTSKTGFENLSGSKSHAISKNRNDFFGIFDSASIGMWLTGIDPKNNYGFTKYFDMNALEAYKTDLNPNAYSLELSDKNRLYYINGKRKLEVFNLHVHSKSKDIFSQKWSLELARLVRLSSSKLPYSEFSPIVFFDLILANLQKRTLFWYVYNSPIFKPIPILVRAIKRCVKN